MGKITGGQIKPEKLEYFEDKFWPLIDWEKVSKKECSERREAIKKV
jgi:hypothetical protein